MLKELLGLCFCLAVTLAQESPEQQDALVRIRAFAQDPPEEPQQLLPLIRQRRQMNPMEMAGQFGQMGRDMLDTGLDLAETGMDMMVNGGRSILKNIPMMGQAGFAAERKGRSRRHPQGQPQMPQMPPMPQMPQMPQMPGGQQHLN